MCLSRCAGLAAVGCAILASPNLAWGQTAARWANAFAGIAELPVPFVEIDAPYLTVTLTGHDSDSVIVSSTTPGPGLVTLPTPSKRDGVLRFVAPLNQTLITLEIQVPRRTSVRIRTSNYGAVTVTGVHGEIEVENSNAGIELRGVQSSVIAATSNGGISASFDRMPSEGPLSFLTSNAPVYLTIPVGANADLLLETDGRIVSAPVFSATLENQRDSQSVGQALRGSIGNGGVFIRVRTDNSEIHLRHPQ